MHNSPSNSTFKWIWRLPTPPRIKHFIWFLSHHRLPTASYLHKLNITTTPICGICNRANENIEHLLLHCPNAQIVWHNLGLHAHVHLLNNFQEDPLQRLFQFVTIQQPLPQNLLSQTLIPYALWHVWKSRNRSIFEKTRIYPNTQHIISKATEYAYLIHNSKRIRNVASSQYIKWNPPVQGFYKLNSDRACDTITQKMVWVVYSETRKGNG